MTGAVAALSFNYLHTTPYMSLRIDGTQDVVTFVLLIVVGVVAGHLAHVSARRGREAHLRAVGIEGLHELAQLDLPRCVGRGPGRPLGDLPGGRTGPGVVPVRAG